ncbi:hypothetical protein KI387_023344, partial [Taxus chinensis]
IPYFRRVLVSHGFLLFCGSYFLVASSIFANPKNLRIPQIAQIIEDGPMIQLGADMLVGIKEYYMMGVDLGLENVLHLVVIVKTILWSFFGMGSAKIDGAHVGFANLNVDWSRVVVEVVGFLHFKIPPSPLLLLLCMQLIFM